MNREMNRIIGMDIPTDTPEFYKAFYAGEQEGMEKGLKAIRKIFNLKQGELCKVFPDDDYDDNDIGWLYKYSMRDIYSYLSIYEEESNKRIKIDDVVIMPNGKRGVVQAIYNENVFCMTLSPDNHIGDVIKQYEKDELKTTNERFCIVEKSNLD